MLPGPNPLMLLGPPISDCRAPDMLGLDMAARLAWPPPAWLMVPE